MLFCRLRQTSQEGIKEHIEKGKIERVGVTTDVERRHNQYKRDGYTGIMLYAPTDNMKRAEDKFLRVCSDCHRNIQRRSNASEESGYVYGIAKRH